MKPFNLEAALAGAPCITREGKHARVFATLPEMGTLLSTQRIVGIQIYGSEHWQIFTWQENGKFFDDEHMSDHDLFEKEYTEE